MAKQSIEINDFALFSEFLKSGAKVLESAKFIVGPGGIEIYGAKETIARCELTTNAVTSSEPITFSIENMQMFLKVVSTVKEVHENDFSGLKFYLDLPFLRFESKKFKTKFSTCNENVISRWVSTKVTTKLDSVFEFTTTSDLIKRVNGHSFMFANPKDVRVYLETKADMENNSVFATIGNKETELNNEMTLKFGLVNFGSLYTKNEDGNVIDERKIIIDLDRLNLFNAVPSTDIKFSLMNLSVLMSKTRVTGENNTFFDMVVYSTLLKA